MTELIIMLEKTGYKILEDGIIIGLKGVPLYQGTLKKGAKMVTLCMNKKPRGYLVHRLVAMKYIPNPDNKPQINHINEIRSDNNVENLEWTTCLENVRHGTGIARRQTTQGRVVIQTLLDGTPIRIWKSIASAVACGYRYPAIIDCCAGRSKSHYGYKWIYF